MAHSMCFALGPCYPVAVANGSNRKRTVIRTRIGSFTIYLISLTFHFPLHRIERLWHTFCCLFRCYIPCSGIAE
jgi:hypothetical protein